MKRQSKKKNCHGHEKDLAQAFALHSFTQKNFLNNENIFSTIFQRIQLIENALRFQIDPLRPLIQLLEIFWHFQRTLRCCMSLTSPTSYLSVLRSSVLFSLATLRLGAHDLTSDALFPIILIPLNNHEQIVSKRRNIVMEKWHTSGRYSVTDRL